MPPYTLRISKRARRISLRIDHRGLVIVSPRKMSETEISRLIQKHSEWITKQQARVRNKSQQSIKLLDGASITLFGDTEIIKYDELPPRTTRSKVLETAEALVVQAQPGKHKQTLMNWLKKTAAQGITARTRELAQQYSFRYSGISIRDQSTRWGSCSSERNLNFNWRLMFAPLAILDYVIIHELVHTQEMNHSKRFWAIVSKCYPDYKQARTWLRKESVRLHITML